ncbi:MAG: metallophosphoesterase, partial [Desulfobacterales bacterium]|nr:metallophosphoesterase [Desulfobacterales bacterium]
MALPFFISLSDLHFNPCYDPAITPRLAEAPDEEWTSVFKSSALTSLSAYGKDTNYPLLASLFEALKAHSDAGFVLFSGDFLGHRLREQFEEQTGNKDEAAFQEFIGKTVSYLYRQFEAVFPSQVVFPCMGNDDSICGDYRISPMGDFLGLFTKTWQPVMDRLPGTDGAAFSRTFPLGGYYSARVPGLSGFRIITLNNIFMSQNYLNACHKVPGDTVQAELDWLAWELYNCRAGKQKAWIVCHEPLGVDMYGVLHGKAAECAQNVKDFVKTEYARALQKIYLQWQDTIAAVFCGHTHMDEFRLVMNPDGTPAVPLHVTPSVSPVFGNNPAFQVFTLDPDDGLKDYTTRFYNLDAKGATTWQKTYTFSETYDQNRVDAAAMFAVRNGIKDNPVIREAYIRHYDVENLKNSQLTSGDWPAFYHAVTDLTPA